MTRVPGTFLRGRLLFPLLVSLTVGVLAHRRRATLGLPTIGILAIGILAALANVDLTITGGSPSGQVGAGIGFSTDTLPQTLGHALLLTALALVSLWRLSRRRCQAELR